MFQSGNLPQISGTYVDEVPGVRADDDTRFTLARPHHLNAFGDCKR